MEVLKFQASVFVTIVTSVRYELLFQYFISS